ncbi:MAG: hypothetical protein GC190_15285 [Alphaproteobacteria bacterium]|nr:hypothetical protein [Alphaproteobacteria bacterium]
MKAADERGFDLGAWRVDPARRVLIALDGGREVRLEPRTMDVLLLLASEAGAVISKDRIVASVWGKRAIGDDTLASVISRLRSALSDGKAGRYIETVSKRGYRLLKYPAHETASATPARGQDTVDGLIGKGLAALHTPVPSALTQARAYFEGAIERGADRADAHAGFAQVLFAQHLNGQGRDLIALAKASALTATALDDTYAPGWAALGYATLIANRDFAAADRSLTKAIELNPALLSARRYRAFAMATVGRFVEAEREARAAVEIEPLSFAARADLLQMLLVARRYRHVAAEAGRIIRIVAASSEIWSAKGWAHFFLGEEKPAVEALLESLKLWGTDNASLLRLARAHHTGGMAGLFSAGAALLDAQRVLFVPRPLDIAILRAGAGEEEAAFEALERAVERDDPFLLLMPYLPHLDRLRNYPRFADLLSRVRPAS